MELPRSTEAREEVVGQSVAARGPGRDCAADDLVSDFSATSAYSGSAFLTVALNGEPAPRLFVKRIDGARVTVEDNDVILDAMAVLYAEFWLDRALLDPDLRVCGSDEILDVLMLPPRRVARLLHDHASLADASVLHPILEGWEVLPDFVGVDAAGARSGLVRVGVVGRAVLRSSGCGRRVPRSARGSPRCPLRYGVVRAAARPRRDG